MNNIEQEIRNNLYAFYDSIAQVSGIDSEKQEHWSVIKNAPGNWPRIIYRVDPGIVTPQSRVIFKEKIASGIYPEILIAGDQNIRETDPFLRSIGFYPFYAWKGMAGSGNEITAPELPDDTEVINPKSQADVEQWIKVVTSQLISPARLDQTIVEILIAQPGMKLFMLKQKGVGVSTLLVYTSATSRGLYLLATEKSAQRQGLAKLLVQQVLFQEMQQSVHPIVLHATPKGEALYSKLGFLPYNQFFLYRFLNTQQ